MSTTRKVLTIIFSILIVGAFAFVLTWGIINWSKVKEGMAGNGLYTQDDVQKSYEDGYSTALKDKEEYEKLITGYRDTITTQNDQISQHTSEVNSLNNSIKDYQAQISTLTDQKSAIETQVETLNTIKTNNEITISQLNGQIADLSTQILSLQSNKNENERQIAALTEQLTNLQTLNTQLQETNELNTRTINGLNAQIIGLNNQISELTLQTQNHSAIVNALNVKIAELQKSVSYYEQYLSTLENGDQVVATFEFDGSVYNIQIVNKNSTLSVTEPTSTAYVIFNGWTVNGEPIDLATFRIAQNTKIVADVTHKYEVNFMVDGENYNNQIVLKDAKVTIPTNPAKTGYMFEGWTIDGNSVVNLTTYTVTQNVTFTAKFTKLYSVVFKYEDTTLKTETVKSGNYATAPTAASTAYKVFNGWKVNGVMKDISEYRITADTVFVADITYKYEVKFMADGKVHNTQVVEKHAKPTVPSNPTKTNHVFVGWSVDGTNTVDVSKYMIVGNTTFTAIFRIEKYTVTFKNGDTVISSQEVTNGSYATVPAAPTKTGYVFDGWTLNGTDIVTNIGTTRVTANTTYIAKFSQHCVFDTDYRDQLKAFNSRVTNTNISAFAFKTSTSKTNLLGTLTSGIRVYYTTDSNNRYELDFVADKIIAPSDCSKLFSSYDNMKTLDLGNFDTSNVTNMSHMFYANKGLTALNLSSFNTSKVTNMSDMFRAFNSEIDLDLSSFDTSKVTTMYQMFYVNKIKTLNISSFNTSKVTDMTRMFSTSSNLKSLSVSNFDTHNVTTMESMFAHTFIETLDLSSFNTSKVTNMACMFYEFYGTSLNVKNFDTSKADIYEMFYWAYKLTSLDLSSFTISNETTLSSLFYYCSGLQYLDISKFDTRRSGLNYSMMFYHCDKLHKANIKVGQYYTLNNLPN